MKVQIKQDEELFKPIEMLLRFETHEEFMAVKRALESYAGRGAYQPYLDTVRLIHAQMGAYK